MKGFVLLVLLVSLVVLCFIQSTIAEEQGVQQEKLEVNNNKINIEEMDGLSKERREELEKRREELKERALRFEKESEEERTKRLQKIEEERKERQKKREELFTEEEGPDGERKKKIDPETLEKMRNNHYKGKREITNQEAIEADTKRFAEIEEIMKANGKTDEDIQRIREVMITKRKTGRKNGPRDEL